MNSRYARFWFIYVILLGTAAASGAVYVSVTSGDPVGLLLRNILTGPVTLGIVSWSLLASALRWATIGKMVRTQLVSKVALFYWGSRLALILAILALGVTWFVSLALALSSEAAILGAVVFIVMITAFTGLLAGAIGNCVLVAKFWRKPKR
jgi:hypothetical protein